ncbi:MAG: YihY/virulence factor BrkB family protein [Gemmatimonadales bacterium]|nr:YihY/virulence factor BrkB family protein [Gemmatimonadales bacterium]
MAFDASALFGLVKQSGKDFIEDDCPTMAAALSYYTVFALPPLLLLILLLVGTVLDPREVEVALEGQAGSFLGPSGREQVKTIVESANQPGAGGLLPTILGIAGLVLGATGVFGQLQAALNKAWEVEPDPQQGGIKNFIFKRVFSFGMVLALAFLLLVSLALTAMLSAFGDGLGRFLPEGLSEPVLHVFNFLVSFGVISLLFAAMFKVLPDATLAWRDVWVGAIATAFLFVLGKFLLGLYLGRSNPGEAFGAAGSLAVMLVWIYYSSMILLLGAEFTQTWADERGSGVKPEEGAVRAVREKRHER